MSKPKSSRSRIANDESGLCQFGFADGRACRMLRQPDHPSLCIFHARAERQLLESDRLGSELAASLTGRFMTATDINFVLGKLFKAIAQNRVQPRVAANLAFVAKLLLQSLDHLKDEYRFEYKYEAWKAMQREAINLSDPPEPIPPGTKPLPASAQALATRTPLYRRHFPSGVAQMSSLVMLFTAPPSADGFLSICGYIHTLSLAARLVANARLRRKRW